MSMALEDAIMREVWQGNEPAWSNGSGTCHLVRKQAAHLLPDAIQKHHDAGEPIAAPHPGLMQLMQEAAQDWDKEEYILTIAWKVAADIIRQHIHAHSEPNPKRYLSAMVEEIRTVHQPARSLRWNEAVARYWHHRHS